MVDGTEFHGCAIHVHACLADGVLDFRKGCAIGVQWQEADQGVVFLEGPVLGQREQKQAVRRGGKVDDELGHPLFGLDHVREEVGFESASIKPVEPFRGRKPDEAIGILDNVVNTIAGQAIQC